MSTPGQALPCRRSRRSAALAGALLALLGCGPAVAAEAAFPAKVRAIYAITWNGLEFGKFSFTSDFKDGQYTLNGDAKLEALFGAFSWRGITRSLGSLSGGSPHPVSYAFKFDGNDKSGRVDMKFSRDAVTKVSSIPPVKPNPGRVPVTQKHLIKVLDPLSAIIAISGAGGKTAGKNPCARRVSIFDGKQRFDLVLSFVRNESIEGGHKGYVCRVKYVPIAGHKMNDETKYMAATEGIEVWLVPLEQANLFVPYHIVLPTWAGSAALTSTNVQIDVPGRGRIALN